MFTVNIQTLVKYPFTTINLNHLKQLLNLSLYVYKLVIKHYTNDPHKVQLP